MSGLDTTGNNEGKKIRRGYEGVKDTSQIPTVDGKQLNPDQYYILRSKGNTEYIIYDHVKKALGLGEGPLLSDEEYDKLGN